MQTNQKTILWLTGMPCSGKSTLADEVEKYFKKAKKPVQKLDGDLLRATISKDLGFSKEDRYKQVERTAYIADMLAANGIVVVVALVSPYAEMRAHAKEICNTMKEVYVKCSAEECRKRDVKGMYKKALSGELKNFTGVDDTYEVPAAPDLVIDTEHTSIHRCVEKMIALVEEGVSVAQ